MDNPIPLIKQAQSGSIPARNELILLNKSKIAAIAKGFENTVMSKNDLISEGVLGLIDAISMYDTGQSTSFSAYTSLYIRGSIIRAVEKKTYLVHVPRSAIRAKLQNAEAVQAVYPIDDEDEEMPIRYSRFCPPWENLDHSTLGHVIDECLARLTPRCRSVIEQRYGLDGSRPKTCREIGEKLGCADSGAQTLEYLALSNLGRMHKLRDVYRELYCGA